MILPPGHAERTASLRRLSSRERRMVSAVGVLAIALAVTVVLAFALGSGSSTAGCIDLTVAGPVGAEPIHECGSAARSLCQSLGAPGSYTGVPGHEIAQSCRSHGFAVGPFGATG